jgi:hypothetical protein
MCYPKILKQQSCIVVDLLTSFYVSGRIYFNRVSFFEVPGNEFCDSDKAREDILQFWFGLIRTNNFSKPSSSTDTSNRKQFTGI